MNASPERQALIDEWLTKAEADYQSMVRLERVNDDAAVSGGICFFGQQCIEKLMKVALIVLGEKPAKTHNLVDLSAALKRLMPDWAANEDELRFLSTAAVEFRYPGVEVELSDATQATTFCTRYRTALMTLIKKHS